MLTTPEFLIWIVGLLFFVFFGEAIASLVGYIVFAVLTLGIVQVEGPEDKDLKFPWHGFTQGPRGRLVVQSSVASFLGIVVCIASVIVFFAWKSARTSP